MQTVFILNRYNKSINIAQQPNFLQTLWNYFKIFFGSPSFKLWSFFNLNYWLYETTAILLFSYFLGELFMVASTGFRWVLGTHVRWLWCMLAFHHSWVAPYPCSKRRTEEYCAESCTQVLTNPGYWPHSRLVFPEQRILVVT